jgi:hypothetical protein
MYRIKTTENPVRYWSPNGWTEDITKAYNFVSVTHVMREAVRQHRELSTMPMDHLVAEEVPMQVTRSPYNTYSIRDI